MAEFELFSRLSLDPPLARLEYGSVAEFELIDRPSFDPPLARLEYVSEAEFELNSRRSWPGFESIFLDVVRLGSFDSTIVLMASGSSLGLERASATTLDFPWM